MYKKYNIIGFERNSFMGIPCYHLWYSNEDGETIGFFACLIMNLYNKIFHRFPYLDIDPRGHR
jgi:hypothetical protein